MAKLAADFASQLWVLIGCRKCRVDHIHARWAKFTSNHIPAKSAHHGSKQSRFEFQQLHLSISSRDGNSRIAPKALSRPFRLSSCEFDECHKIRFLQNTSSVKDYYTGQVKGTYCYTLFGNLGCDLLQTCWRRCCNTGRNVRGPTGETQRKDIAVGNASDQGN